MKLEEAYNKAIELADLLGIKTVTHNADGSKTIREPKRVKEININDMIEIIMK